MRAISVFVCLLSSLFVLPAAALDWTKTNGPDGAWVRGADQDSAGTVWLATTGAGVFTLSSGSDVWQPSNNGLVFNGLSTGANSGSADNQVIDITIAGDDTPIVVTVGTVQRFTGGSWASSASGIDFTSFGGRDLLTAPNGDVYLSASALYRSTDNGASWSRRGDLSTSNALGADSNGNIFVATTDLGDKVFVSTDDGDTFAVAQSGLPGFGLVVGFAPDASGTMLAFTSSGEVFATSDAGQNWTSRAGVTSATPSSPNAALVASDGTVLVGSAGGYLSNQFTGLRISTNNGSSFTNAPIPRIETTPVGSTGSTIGTSLQLADGRLLYGMVGAGVFVTETAGGDFSALNKGLEASRNFFVLGAERSLIAGSRGAGFSCTTDGGQNWVSTNVGPLSGDAFVAQDVTLTNGDRVLFGATGQSTSNFDNVVVSTNGGASWDRLPTTLAMFSVNRMIQASDGRLYAAGVGSGGSGGPGIQVAPIGAEPDLDFQPAGLASPQGVDVAEDSDGNIYAISGGAVYRRARSSAPNGEWTRIDNVDGNGLPGVANYQSLLGDDLGNVYLYNAASFEDAQGVFVSTDQGATWTLRRGGLPTSTVPFGIGLLAKLQQAPNGTVYLTSRATGIFATTNAGVSWVNETGNLPATVADPANLQGSISLGFAADGTVFVGTEGAGVWSSGTAGAGSYANGIACDAGTAPNPLLDTGYGDGGLQVLNELRSGTVPAVADAQGRVLMIGADNTFQLVLFRLTEAGEVDTSFGNGGTGLVPIERASERGFVNAAELAVAPDGKILIAGAIRLQDQDNRESCYVGRYNADGTPDTGFGTNGSFVVPAEFAEISRCSSVAIAASGATYLPAFVRRDSVSTNGIFYLTPAGALDSAFSDDGLVLNSELGIEFPLALGSAENAILATAEGGNNRLIKLTPNGTLDSAYGTNGSVALPDSPSMLLRGPDGAVVTLAASAADFNAVTNTVVTSDDDGLMLDSVVLAGQQRLVLSGNLAVAVDGSIVTAAPDSANGGAPSALYVNNPDGTANTDWDDDGKGIIVPGSTNPCDEFGQFSPRGLVITSDRKALLSGECRISNQNRPATVRTIALPDPASGGGGGTDTTPNAFTFTDQTGVAQAMVVVSNAVTISGIDAPAAITVTGGEYSIGCSTTFTSAAGTISSGEQVCVQHTSASAASSSVDTTLTVGGVSDTFTSTTAADTGGGTDTTPDAFTFVDVTDVASNTVVVSNTVTIAGIDAAAAVSVTAGEYAIGCTAGTFTSSPGTIRNGSTVCVRHTTSAMSGGSVNTTLTIGGVSDTFTSTTIADNGGGDADTVTDANGNPTALTTDVGSFANVSNSAAPPAGSNPPSGVSFPNGVFAFDITGLANGATATVTITLPAGATPDTYYKFQNGGSFEFLRGAGDDEGAVINGNVITLTLIDGGLGDSDGQANGTIVDPGAPGVTAATPPPTTSEPANVSVSSSGSLGLWLLGAFALLGLRRRRVSAKSGHIRDERRAACGPAFCGAGR